jgi:DNA-binding transcriptional ArsR family regulator
MKTAAARKPDAARVLHALGDPTRRAIVERLVRGPASISAIAAPLDITITAVAQHLRVLEKSGLARTKKVGRVRTCFIEPRGFSVLETWISYQRALMDARLDRLGALLEEDDE